MNPTQPGEAAMPRSDVLRGVLDRVGTPILPDDVTGPRIRITTTEEAIRAVKHLPISRPVVVMDEEAFATLRTQHKAALEELERIQKRAVMETCDRGHDYLKLNGEATRCPKCLAEGNATLRTKLAEAEKDAERLAGALEDIAATTCVATVEEALRGGNTPLCAYESMQAMAGVALAAYRSTHPNNQS